MTTPAGGAQTGGAQGVLGVNTQPFVQGLQQAADAAEQFAKRVSGITPRVNRGLSETDNIVRGVNRAFGALAGGIQGVAAIAGVAGVVQLAKMGNELARTGAEAERLEASFTRLAGGVGASSASMLAALDKAARGTIADTDLMLSANRALLLGVASNTEQLASLLEIARERAHAMGTDTARAFNDIVIGIGRNSPRILDNLGIIVDAEAAYKKYAASLGVTADRLSATGRAHALTAEIIEKNKDLIGKAGDDAASSWEKAAAAGGNFRVALGKAFEPQAVAAVDAYTRALHGVTSALKEIDQLQRQGRVFGGEAGIWSGAPLGMVVPGDRAGRNVRGGGRARGDLARPGASIPGGAGTSGDILPIDIDARNQAAFDWYVSVNKIERQAGQARVDATRQYEQQRTDAIRNYEQGIARDAEDFAISRRRQQEDYERDAARIGSDAQKQSIQAERDFARQRARNEREHNDNLREAAMHLDAEAVYREQKRFAQQTQDAEEERRDRRQLEQENQRERLDDLRAALELAREREDEDRALAEGRREKDFADQLNAQQRAYNERLVDIDRHLGEERDEINRSFGERLSELGLFNAAYAAEAKRGHDAALRAFAGLGWSDPALPPARASNTPVGQTVGADILRPTGARTTVININSGAFPVMPGMSADDVRRYAYEGMVQFVRERAGQ